jgi:hypothetical protein
MQYSTSAVIAAAIAITVAACSAKKSDNGSSGGGGSTTNFTISGNLTSRSTTGYATLFNVAKNQPVRTMVAKTITHVIARSASSSGEAFVGTVGNDGSFNIGINTGDPYIFVFVDDTQTGSDMIVGIFDPGDATTGLDTLVPLNTNGTTSLGEVTVDGTAGTASMTTTFTDFLNALGIDSTTAATVGGVDDLALRLANPDVDQNGEIDLLENKTFVLDIHARTDIHCDSGCAGGVSLDHANGAYITAAAGFSLSPSLTSVYAVYPTTFDSNPITQWVASSGVSTSLSNGATFQVTDMPGGGTADIDSVSSYSGGSFSSNLQWGGDYSMGAGIELPGYDHPVKITYGFNSKTLEFSNFRSRPKASLFSILPDIKINSTAGKITSVDYRWLKWSGTAWVAATADEVQVIAQAASVGLYTVKTSGSEQGVMVMVPTSAASGTVAWNDTNVMPSGGLTTAIADLEIDDFCGGTTAYRDKLGLMIFPYSFLPVTTGTPPSHCP